MLAVSLVAGLAWALPHAAHACTCIVPPAPAVAAEQAEAVFEARVEGVQGATDPSGPGMVRFELSVVRVFKGELSTSAQLVTRASSAACGRSLVVGKRYLVYAGRDNDGNLTDTLCSRTRPMSAADEDLVALGPGASPSSTPPPTDRDNREPPRIEAPPPVPASPAPAARRGCDLAGAGGLTGLVLVLVPRRRRRR